MRRASRSQGADNTLPHLNDLGRPQLPFSSIALGIQALRPARVGGPAAAGPLGRRSACWPPTRSSRASSTGAPACTPRSCCARCRCTSCRRARCSATSAPWRRSRWPSAGSPWPRSTATSEGPTPIWPARCRGWPWRLVGLFVGFESRGGLLGVGVPALAVGLAWAVSRVGSKSRMPTARERRGRRRSLARRGRGRGPRGARHRRAGRREGPEPLGRRDAPRAARSTRRSTSTWPPSGTRSLPWSAFLPFALRPHCSSRRRVADRGARASARAWRGSRSSWGRRVAFAAHGYMRRVRTWWPSAGRRSARWRARWPSATSSAGRTRPSPSGWARCCWRRCSTTTSTSCRRRRTRPSASPGRPSPRASRTARSSCGGWSSAGSPLCAFMTWIERDAEAQAVRPCRIRAGGARAARGVRRDAGARVLRDHRRRVARGPLRVHRRANARALAAADVLEHPRLRAQRVVGRRVRAAAVLFGLLFVADVWLWAFGRSQPLCRRRRSRAGSSPSRSC